MNDSNRRFVRFRGFPFAVLLLALLPAQASAQSDTEAGADAIVRLVPAAGQSGEIEATAGVPVELVVVKTRAGDAAVGEALAWTLEEGADGRLEVIDERTRAAGDRVEAGSARVRFTPAQPGRHALRVQSPVDPACTGVDCRSVAHRFVVLAAVPDAAATARDRHTGLVIGAAAAAGAIALATIADSGGGDPPPGKRLVAVSGNGQSALVNNPLAQPLAVIAMENGRPAVGVVLNWTATGGATLSAATTTTSVQGGSSVQVTSVGPGPGPVTVTASRADDPAVSASFTVGVDVAGLAIASGNNQTTRVDTTTAAPLVVLATLNGVAQAGVALNWQVVSGTATLSGVQGTTDASGLAQAFVDVGPFEGPITILVTRVDAPSVTQLFTVNAVELRALAIVSGDGQSGAQGQPLPAPLVVQATDAAAPDPGVTIFWSATGGATLSAGSTVTDAGGLTSVTVTSMGFGLDPVIVTAARADNPLLSVQFQLAVDPATLAVVAGDGQSGLAGTRAANPVQVLLLDGAGQPMAGQTITWTVVGGSATLDSPVSVTDAAGLASVGFTFGNFPGPITIQAAAFSGGVTASATATSQPPGSLGAASGDGQAGNPGDVLAPLVVQIVDPAPDLSGIPITFTVISGSATLTPTTALTDAAGQASTTVTLGLTPGPVVVQATAPGGVTYTFNLTVNGTLVVTGTSAVSGDGQDLVVGVASAPMVIELLGNGVPLVGVTVTWTTTNGTMATPTTVTDAAGRTSNTVTIAGAGTTIVTASYPTFNEFVGSSVQFVHNAPLAALPTLAVNEASVAEALDAACAAIQLSPTPTPDELDLLQQCQALNNASASDPVAVGEALSQMLPDVAQAQADAGKAATGAQFENLAGRIVQLRSGAPIAKVSFTGLTLAGSGGRLPLGQLGTALLANQAPVEEPVEDSGFAKWGFFFSGNIGRGEVDPTNLTPRYDFDIDGLTAGVDYRWSDRLVFGVALGYTGQDTDLAGGQGSVETQGLSLSAYSTWYTARDWYLDSVLTLGRNRYDHERAIQYVLPGSVVDQVATASSDGTDLSATVTFGKDFQRQAWTFGVYGRAAYNRLSFDEFEEEVDSTINGNGLALRVESRTVTGLSTTLGGKVVYAYSASWGVLMPQAELEWQHDFQSDAEAFRGFFLDDPSQTPILVLGDDLDSDYLRLSLGLSMVLTRGRSGFVTYDRILARSGISQEMLTIGFRMEF